jgi:hypothetical protein
MGDIERRKLEWDTTTGKPPRVGEKIKNGYGETFEVIERKGNTVVIKKVEG